jgi:hypothetical protein
MFRELVLEEPGERDRALYVVGVAGPADPGQRQEQAQAKEAPRPLQ